MGALTVYSSSVITPLVKSEMGKAAEMNQYCRDNRVEVLFYDDRMMVCCGVKRTYKVPKSVGDMPSLTAWLKGRVEATERVWKKTDLYKILHQ